MVDFGTRIKCLRKADNLTQSQVAQRLGVSKAVISSYENGTRQPSYTNLVKLSQLFKVSTDWLLGNKTINSFDLSSLTQEQVELIINIIKEFKK